MGRSSPRDSESSRTDNPTQRERIDPYLRRVLSKDKTILSDRNVVSQAVVSVTPHLTDPLMLAAPGNYFEVRVCAVRALLVHSPLERLRVFFDIQESYEPGRVRFALCEMTLELPSFPAPELRETPEWREAGLRCFRVLCNRSDFVANKAKLAVLLFFTQFNGFWCDLMFYSVLNII